MDTQFLHKKYAKWNSKASILGSMETLVLFMPTKNMLLMQLVMTRKKKDS